MARKRILLFCMDKKGKSRKIIALTPKLTSDPNFPSVLFRPNMIDLFLDLSSLFIISNGFLDY